MGPLDVENKLQEQQKLKKIENFLKRYNIKNFLTIRSKLTASSNTIHLMFNYKLKR